jgi:dTMP kinase
VGRSPETTSVLKPREERGKFVVYEGIDGSGTTTQASRLANHLRAQGVPVCETSEPTRGPFGAVIRQALEGRLEVDERALAVAFAADRYDHLFSTDRGIVARLNAGTWVVCDRYVLSSLVYQAANGMTAEWVQSINRYAVPADLTIFIDTPVDECLSRLSARGSIPDRYEREEMLLAVLERYRRATSTSDAESPLVVVDGKGSVDDVLDATLELVRNHLNMP